MRFTKMHGAGNDYVYIDARDKDLDWPRLAVAMSDRHRGIGSDGVILALDSDRAHLRMRMFNADGSEGEMCGNGVRCLAKFALDRGIVPSGTTPVSVETLAGVVRVTPVWDGNEMVRATVDMGEPSLEADDIPVRVTGLDKVLDYPIQVNGHRFFISCVSMGNPHAVAFVDQAVDDIPLHEIGPRVEQHPMFPQRVNFEIVNVIDRTHLRARVWERGSGLTMACGSGACAIAVGAHLHDYIEDDVSVALPGGELRVRWPGRGQVFLEGPVAGVFEGEWPE